MGFQTEDLVHKLNEFLATANEFRRPAITATPPEQMEKDGRWSRNRKMENVIRSTRLKISGPIGEMDDSDASDT